MGVFAMFRRKAKDGEEASVAEAQDAAVTVDPESEAPEGSDGPAEAATEAEPAAQAPETEQAADGVEIPKQQSAEQAADNEAGEGARK